MDKLQQQSYQQRCRKSRSFQKFQPLMYSSRSRCLFSYCSIADWNYTYGMVVQWWAKRNSLLPGSIWGDLQMSAWAVLRRKLWRWQQSWQWNQWTKCKKEKPFTGIHRPLGFSGFTAIEARAVSTFTSMLLHTDVEAYTGSKFTL